MSLDTAFYYVDFVSRFVSRSSFFASNCEMYHESSRCINISFYTIKHDKIKNNCVIFKNVSLLYSAHEFWKF